MEKQVEQRDPCQAQLEPCEGRQRINIYISKRPWESEEIHEGYCWVVNFLIENTEIEYHLYLENSLRDHKGTLPHKDSHKCHHFDKMTDVDVRIDYAITIGGDGTVLWAHKIFGELDQPIFLCFSGGTLCFLSVYDITEIESTMLFFHGKIMTKQSFTTKSYPRLHSYVCDSNECTNIKKFALNDIVIERSTPSMVILDLYLNDCFAVQVRSDGLLISSSTGSTAYNLSLANGIIMHSDLECVIINPMASMSLSSRPIVVPSSVKVKIVCSMESRADGRLVYDGMDALLFTKGHTLLIETAPIKTRVIVPDDHKEYESWILKLRELRGWK